MVIYTLHGEASNEVWFSVVRHLGPLRSIIPLFHIYVFKKGLSLRQRIGQIKTVAFNILIAPMVTGGAAALLPFLISISLPASVQHGAPGIFFEKWIEESFFLGAVIGFTIWLHGLSYIARPTIRERKRISRLWLPSHEGEQQVRDRLALNLFWYSRIRLLAILSATYAIEVLIIAGEYISGHSSDQNAPAARTTQYPMIINLSFAALILGPPMAIAIFASKKVERRMVAVQLYSEIGDILSAEGDYVQKEAPLELVADPLAAYRAGLSRVASLLEEVATQLDSRQPRGFTPHPIATTMRASAEFFKEYLRSDRSLATELPSDVLEVLSAISISLLHPDDPTSYRGISDQISSFNDDGLPIIEPSKPRPGPISSLIASAGTNIKTAAVVITSGATIAGIALSLIFSLVGKIDLDTLLGSLR